MSNFCINNTGEKPEDWIAGVRYDSNGKTIIRCLGKDHEWQLESEEAGKTIYRGHGLWTSDLIKANFTQKTEDVGINDYRLTWSVSSPAFLSGNGTGWSKLGKYGIEKRNWEYSGDTAAFAIFKGDLKKLSGTLSHKSTRNYRISDPNPKQTDLDPYRYQCSDETIVLKVNSRHYGGTFNQETKWVPISDFIESYQVNSEASYNRDYEKAVNDLTAGHGSDWGITTFEEYRQRCNLFPDYVNETPNEIIVSPVFYKEGQDVNDGNPGPGQYRFIAKRIDTIVKSTVLYHPANNMCAGGEVGIHHFVVQAVTNIVINPVNIPPCPPPSPPKELPSSSDSSAEIDDPLNQNPKQPIPISPPDIYVCGNEYVAIKGAELDYEVTWTQEEIEDAIRGDDPDIIVGESVATGKYLLFSNWIEHSNHVNQRRLTETRIAMQSLHEANYRNFDGEVTFHEDAYVLEDYNASYDIFSSDVRSSTGGTVNTDIFATFYADSNVDDGKLGSRGLNISYLLQVRIGRTGYGWSARSKKEYQGQTYYSGASYNETVIFEILDYTFQPLPLTCTNTKVPPPPDAKVNGSGKDETIVTGKIYLSPTQTVDYSFTDTANYEIKDFDGYKLKDRTVKTQLTKTQVYGLEGESFLAIEINQEEKFTNNE